MRDTLNIITDAWTPQVNGVVKTLESTINYAQKDFEISIIEPSLWNNEFIKPIMYNKKEYVSLVPFAYNKIKNIFNHSMPDYIHIAVEGPLGWAARNYCIKHKLKFTTAYHTMFPEYINTRFGIPLKLSYYVMKKFHQPSNNLMVVSESLKDILVQNGFNNQFRKWIRGVDSQLFNPKWRDMPFNRTFKPYALYVGRITKEKNIEAFLQLKIHDLHKVIVGDGPLLDELKAKYKDTIFLGNKHGEELAQLYANAEVFVFPSLSDTFGLVLIEALSSGTPVAAFPCHNTIEIINSDVGILDFNLLNAINEARLKDRSACREYTILNYSWEKATNQFVDNLVSV